MFGNHQRMAYVWAASSGTCSLVVRCCWLTEGGWRLAVPTDGCLLADAPKMRVREMQVVEIRRRGFRLDSGQRFLRNYCFPASASFFFVVARLPLAAYKKMMGFFDLVVPLTILR